MELFRGVNVDWLGKKWYFLAFSLIFSVCGSPVDAFLAWHQAGASTFAVARWSTFNSSSRQTSTGFARRSTAPASMTAASRPTERRRSKQVAISLAQKETQESALDIGRETIVQALNANYSSSRAGESGQAGSGQCQPGSPGPVSGAERPRTPGEHGRVPRRNMPSRPRPF